VIVPPSCLSAAFDMGLGEHDVAIMVDVLSAFPRRYRWSSRAV
jgi:hypothetical protein